MTLHLRPDLRELQGKMCFGKIWARIWTAGDGNCPGDCCTIFRWRGQGLDCEALTCVCGACLYQKLDMRGSLRQ